MVVIGRSPYQMLANADFEIAATLINLETLIETQFKLANGQNVKKASRRSF